MKDRKKIYRENKKHREQIKTAYAEPEKQDSFASELRRGLSEAIKRRTNRS